MEPTEAANDSKPLSDNVKLKLSTNYVSHKVYELFSNSGYYLEAINILNSSRRQQVGEIVGQYVQVLLFMSRNCNFNKLRPNIIKINLYEMMSFINGLIISHIHRKLLENNYHLL